jgi:hypothetical protein
MSPDPFSDGALPVRSSGRIAIPVEDINDDFADPAPATRELPAVVVDADGRPDVADLPRVVATDGVGDLRCGIGVDDTGPAVGWRLRLEVLIDHPVQCRYHLVVPWATWRLWLRHAAAAGAIAIGVDGGDPNWLVLDVDPDRLLGVLDLLDDRAG